MVDLVESESTVHVVFPEGHRRCQAPRKPVEPWKSGLGSVREDWSVGPLGGRA